MCCSDSFPEACPRLFPIVDLEFKIQVNGPGRVYPQDFLLAHLAEAKGWKGVGKLREEEEKL